MAAILSLSVEYATARLYKALRSPITKARAAGFVLKLAGSLTDWSTKKARPYCAYTLFVAMETVLHVCSIVWYSVWICHQFNAGHMSHNLIIPHQVLAGHLYLRKGGGIKDFGKYDYMIFIILAPHSDLAWFLSHTHTYKDKRQTFICGREWEEGWEIGDVCWIILEERT